MITELFSSVLVSGVGAVLGFATAQVWRGWRLARVMHLCSIDGAYETHFAHEVNGEIVKRIALTQLSQLGVRVWGVTTELETNRAWELEGEIDCSGFLRASFRALDGDATLTRTILLAIDRGGEKLHGLWTSCNESSLQVTSGQYAMQRCETI